MRANREEIDFVFRHEREIREAVLEAKLGGDGHTGGSASGHSYISDPTPASALRRVGEVGCVMIRDSIGERKIVHPEMWLKAVSSVREWCRRDNVFSAIFERVLTAPRSKTKEEARRRRDMIRAEFIIPRSKFYKVLASIVLYRSGVVGGMNL